MKILLSCEGSAEDPNGSFSGITYSVVRELRGRGHEVLTNDVELRGIDRWVTAGLTFKPNRAQWGSRFRLGERAFDRRSRQATRFAAAHGDADLLFQIGATFQARSRTVPYVMYCDSNIRMAQRGALSGQSDAVWLSEGELRDITEREAVVYREASHIFTLSERLRRSFIEDFGTEPSRVTAVHAGPNFDVSAIPERAAERSAKQPPTILFVGKQFERKGGPQLLAAFREVRRRLPNARLLVVGPDEVPGAYQGIECLGFLRKSVPEEAARLKDAYARADVFCLPTKYEPYGVVFLEAMFFGLPCVGPSAWAVPEMITDGETGLLFPSDDTDALTRSLLRILTEPEFARACGEAGRARAYREFTWSAVVDRMLDRITAVVGSVATAASGR